MPVTQEVEEEKVLAESILFWENKKKSCFCVACRRKYPSPIRRVLRHNSLRTSVSPSCHVSFTIPLHNTSTFSFVSPFFSFNIYETNQKFSVADSFLHYYHFQNNGPEGSENIVRAQKQSGCSHVLSILWDGFGSLCMNWM